MNYPTPEELQSLFVYDKQTGSLLYRRKPRGRGNNQAGDPAGTIYPNGYLMVMIKRKRYYVHRLVWLIHHGSIPEILDHINGDKLDNRIENLRPATRSENAWNATRKPKGSSKFTGVCWTPSGFVAYISHMNERVHIGYFEEEEDAAKAYNLKAQQLRGDRAVLNDV